MKYEVWISSFVPNDIGWQYLQWTLESCNHLNTKATICLAIHVSNKDVNELKNIIHDIVIYPLESKTPQFTTLGIIYNKRKDQLNENDVILFLDDDDLLLSNAFDEIINDYSVDGRISYQYEPLESIPLQISSNISIDIFPYFLEKYRKDIKIITDFSGTIIKFKHLDKFFDKNYEYKYALDLRDLDFCEYIETLPNIRREDLDIIPDKSVTVYHRIKEYKSTWTENFTVQ